MADGTDDAIAAAFGGSKRNDKNLVFAGIDDFVEFGFEIGKLGGVEVAFKNGKLQMIAKVAACFENTAETFGIGHIVGNDVGGSHGGVRMGSAYRGLLCGEKDTLGNL